MNGTGLVPALAFTSSLRCQGRDARPPWAAPSGCLSVPLFPASRRLEAGDLPSWVLGTAGSQARQY